MKRLLSVLLTGIVLVAANQPATVCAETETIDLKALAKKARPAVMLLVVSDANGKEIATGTGFVVSSDGKLITNFHVIEKAASAIAKSENGGLFPVEGVLASDPKNDLVLLKLKAKDLPFLTLGKSENIEVGTRIAVIGSPLGLEGTLSEGIVSAVRELMGDMKILLITAAISSESRGSPVMDAKGDVIGIVSAGLLKCVVSADAARNLVAKADKAAPQSLATRPIRQDDAIFADYIFWAAALSEVTQNYIEELKHCQILVKSYPESALAWASLGFSCLKLDRNDDAIFALQKAIKLKPDYASAWSNLGVTYIKADRNSEAIAAFQQAIKIKSDFAEPWCNLGFCLGKAGQLDVAIANLRRAITLKPDFADAWRNLGVFLSEAGHSAEGITAFRQAIKINPELASAWSGLGGGLGAVGRNDDAIAAFRQAVKLQPNFVSAWCGLGACLATSGRTGDATNAFREAIKIKPDHADAWYGLGITYGSTGRSGDEIAAYRQAITIKPDYADAWYNLGVVYVQSGRTNDAIAAFNQARKLKPELFK